MVDLTFELEADDDVEETLHRLADAVRRLQAEQAVLSELVLALTGRVFQLEHNRSLPRPFTERR